MDGRLHKLSADLTWQYDKTDFRRPWRIANPAGRLELTFIPFLERVAVSNVWLVRSEVHQVFAGTVGTSPTRPGI